MGHHLNDSNGYGIENLIGKGHHGDGVFTRGDLDSFAVQDGIQEPALALFDQVFQGKQLAFLSKKAL